MLNPKNYRPRLDGQGALDHERRARLRATENAHSDPVFAAQFTSSNSEEQAYSDAVPTNFTKGLYHDEMGMARTEDYEALVKALRAPPDPDSPDTFFVATQPDGPTPRYVFDTYDADEMGYVAPDTRKWESPLGGLNTDLQGPSISAVAQPAAPKVGSSELTAELAEVYAMALLRDLSFKDMEDPNSTLDIGGETVTVQQIIDELNNLPWFDATKPVMGILPGGHEVPLSAQETRRRMARLAPGEGSLTTKSLFRGSSKGAMSGPYVSQFMLLGSEKKNAENGLVRFGVQTIDQRVQPDAENVDYMTNFLEWRDVQNGAKFSNIAPTDEPRFLTTLRDMASYVHFDQLYQAYFNAALILARTGLKPDQGLPNANAVIGGQASQREGFATWGVPHLLALVAEVSSRALRVVRRQKFQIHRRARPEVLAAKLAMVASGYTDAAGSALPQFQRMLDELMTHAPNLMRWVKARNTDNNLIPAEERGLTRNDAGKAVTGPELAENYLLPMAFAEGSPMHPAYGAGHATVAGACVTVLKAFFDTVGDDHMAIPWPVLGLPENKVGAGENLDDSGLPDQATVSGELDKLAANISIGRNMGGVHYYTDYYESVRMGERIATQILYQNMLTSPEHATMRFIDFDGRVVTLSATPRKDIRFPDALETQAEITVFDPVSMTAIAAEDWWGENVADASLTV